MLDNPIKVKDYKPIKIRNYNYRNDQPDKFLGDT